MYTMTVNKDYCLWCPTELKQHVKLMNSKATLQEKSPEEIQTIAAEYGINTAKKDTNELIYEILDYEASHVAAQKAATEKPRKRSRIKTVDHVYSANKSDSKKIDKQTTVAADNSLFNDLSFEEKEMLNDIKAEQNESEEAALAVESPKRKRGRPRKNDPIIPTPVSTVQETTETQDEGAAISNDVPTDTPKRKRGRPRKNAFDSLDETVSTNEETEKVETPQEPTNMSGEDTAVVATQKRSLLDFGKGKSDGDEANAGAAVNTEDESAQRGGTGTMPTDKELPAGQSINDEADFIIIEDIPSLGNVQSEPAVNLFDKIKSDANKQTTAGNDTNATAVSKGVQEPYNLNDIIEVSGVLDMSGDFGFLRSSDYNYLSSPDDIYVNPAQVKHYGLKTGDVVEGTIRPPRDNEKFFPLVRVNKINGCDPSVIRDRVPFEYLTPLFPNEKFRLCSGKHDSSSSRIVDLFSPIGKGQRALIVAQPKTGKTLLMKDIANSIARNHPEAYLMMLLIDERPEEVTDMARTVNAEVIASTFDAPADNHVKIANLVLEKAKRMVECGHDVVIFLDSITRLARAYNTVSPASGKVLTGGVDANALQKPKRFFGAARNIEGGGSLTIIATALIDTGSKMDEVIFEEFKGTGNMELQLDRTLANKRIYPAVNLIASSTRRDDLLQDDQTRRFMWIIRNHISDMTNVEAMDTILKHIERTSNNEEFLATMNG